MEDDNRAMTNATTAIHESSLPTQRESVLLPVTSTSMSTVLLARDVILSHMHPDDADLTPVESLALATTTSTPALDTITAAEERQSIISSDNGKTVSFEPLPSEEGESSTTQIALPPVADSWGHRMSHLYEWSADWILRPFFQGFAFTLGTHIAIHGYRYFRSNPSPGGSKSNAAKTTKKGTGAHPK